MTEQSDGIRLAIKVVPGASRDRVVGPLGDALKIAVAKPPEAGAANKAVIALLAEALALAPTQIRIVQGHAHPRKQLLITGIGMAELRTRLDMIGR